MGHLEPSDEKPVRLPSRDKRNSLIHEVEELSGEKVHRCYQCGKCTSGCPFVNEMDIKPNQVIRLVQMGLIDVLDVDAIWFCAACEMCSVRCPKGVKLAKVMEALRTILLRRSIDRFKTDHLGPDDLKDIPNIAIVSVFRKETG
jgi:heterodisulfide reductase subunit C